METGSLEIAEAVKNNSTLREVGLSFAVRARRFRLAEAFN